MSAICYCTEWLPSLMRTEFYTSTNSGNQGITKNEFHFLSSNVHETEDGTEQIRPGNSLSGLTSIYQTIDKIKQDSNTIETKQSPNIISSMEAFTQKYIKQAQHLLFSLKIKPRMPIRIKQIKLRWILRFRWNLHLCMCKNTQPACVDHEECDPGRPSDMTHDADIYA